MRSATGRRVGSSRLYSMKPVTLPMQHPSCFHCMRGGRAEQYAARYPRDAEHAFVFVREHFHKFGQRRFPVLDKPLGLRATGILAVARDQAKERLDILGIGHGLEVD